MLALFRMYQEEGAVVHAPSSCACSERGGSDTPQNLLAPLGVDFRDAGFWQKGFDELRRLVTQAQDLADKVGA